MNNSVDIGETTQKTTHITNESLNSTRRMLGLIHESQDAGAQTLQMLHKQGDTLNRTEKGLDNVHTSLLKSKKHIKEMTAMEKCPCCIFCCPKKKKINKRETDSKNKKSSPLEHDTFKQLPNKDNVDRSMLETNTITDHKNNNPVFSLLHNKNNNPAISLKNKTDQHDSITAVKEADKNLEEINEHIGGLKHQAIDMGQTVTSHNTQIKRLNKKAEKHIDKIDIVTKTTTNLIKAVSDDKTRFFSCCRICNIL